MIHLVFPWCPCGVLWPHNQESARACPRGESKSHASHATLTTLGLQAREQYEALQAARQRQTTAAFKAAVCDADWH
jgi:hypothetical protein